MRYAIKVLFFLITLVSCNEGNPRRAVSKNSGKLIGLSVNRNKRLLDREVKFIKKAISQDSIRIYTASKEGFWYAYLEKHSDAVIPGVNDKLLVTYDIKTLDLQPIYEYKDIGQVELLLGKEGDIFMGMRKMLGFMREGERVRVFFPSSLAYSYSGDDNRIGINVPLCCDIKLMKVVKKK